MDIDYVSHKRSIQDFIEAGKHERPYQLGGKEARKAVEVFE